MKKSMNILHCSDLHFNLSWYEWVYAQQASYDALCLTGDFLDTALKIPIQEQVLWVRSWLATISKPIFVCSGNHDYDENESLDWLTTIPNVYADGTIKTLDGIKFGCIPYLATDYDMFEACDILLAHVPPAKTDTAIDSKSKKDLGDKDLSRYLIHHLLRPRILLCGHVHAPLRTKETINACSIYTVAINKKNPTPCYNHIVISAE